MDRRDKICDRLSVISPTRAAGIRDTCRLLHVGGEETLEPPR